MSTVNFSANVQVAAEASAYLLSALDRIGVDLDSFYNMDEASGTRFDARELGADLADVNTVAQVSGKIGSAAGFTAANSECLRAASSTVHDYGDEDWMIVLYGKVNTGAGTGALVSKTALTPANQGQYQLQYESVANRLRLLVFHDGSTAAIVTANNYGAVAKDVFLFIAVYHDSVNNQIGIYVEDAPKNTLAHTTGVKKGSAKFRVGAHGNDESVPSETTFFDGAVDQLAVFNRVLSSATLKALRIGARDLQSLFERTFAVSFDAAANFGAQSSVEKVLVSGLTSSADFSADFSRNRPLQATFDSAADFDTSFRASVPYRAPVQIDFDAAVGIIRDAPLISSFDLDSDFTARLLTSRVPGQAGFVLPTVQKTFLVPE